MIPIAYKEHIAAQDHAIERLVALHNSGVDIGDRPTFYATLRACGLMNDGFEVDEDYIIREVSRRIR